MEHTRALRVLSSLNLSALPATGLPGAARTAARAIMLPLPFPGPYDGSAWGATPKARKPGAVGRSAVFRNYTARVTERGQSGQRCRLPRVLFLHSPIPHSPRAEWAQIRGIPGFMTTPSCVLPPNDNPPLLACAVDLPWSVEWCWSRTPGSFQCQVAANSDDMQL